MDIQKNRVRNIVGGTYDIQKLRIATSNHIVANLQPGPVDDIKEGEEDTKYLPTILSKYRRIADYFVSESEDRGDIEKAITPNNPEYIKSRLDYDLVTSYERLLETEEGLTRVAGHEVKAHPVWDAFFTGVRGCGPLISAVCLAYSDPYKACHAPSFWRYAGLDMQRDPDKDKMRGIGKWYTEKRNYIGKDRKKQMKRSPTYNLFLKTKLVGTLSSAFLRAKDFYYGKVYYNYKSRLNNRDEDFSPIVKYHVATRYAVRMFLRDMWVMWRELGSLGVIEPYEVAKPSHKPHHS